MLPLFSSLFLQLHPYLKEFPFFLQSLVIGRRSFFNPVHRRPFFPLPFFHGNLFLFLPLQLKASSAFFSALSSPRFLLIVLFPCFPFFLSPRFGHIINKPSLRAFYARVPLSPRRDRTKRPTSPLHFLKPFLPLRFVAKLSMAFLFSFSATPSTFFPLPDSRPITRPPLDERVRLTFPFYLTSPSGEHAALVVLREIG